MPHHACPYIISLMLLCLQTSGWKYDTHVLDATFYSDRVLTVTTILIEPYASIRWTNTSQYHSGNDIYEGYIVDLLNHLADIIGFRYRLVPVWDGQFGYRKEDGNWDGMIGELMRKEADIAAGPMFVTDQRERVVDFSRRFMTVEATVIIRKPPDGVPPEIMSVRDLLENERIEYGTLNRGIIRRAFRLSNATLYRKMWDHLRTYQDFLLTETNEEGIDRVRAENYAFIIPNTIAEFVTRRKPCDLMMVDTFLMKQGYGLAVPKGSNLLPYLNRALEILERDGYLRRLYEKWWIEKGDCTPVRSSRVFSLNSATNAHSRHVLGIFSAIVMLLTVCRL